MSKLHFQPIKGQARQILRAILQSPEVSSCRLKEVLAIRLACEEIVMNVTLYAYPESAEGYLDVEIQKDSRIIICFRDGGKPFNPLEQSNPDTKQSWDLRHIGGLGIFLLRRKMDDVRYSYEDNQNVLTIEKKLS